MRDPYSVFWISLAAVLITAIVCTNIFKGDRTALVSEAFQNADPSMQEELCIWAANKDYRSLQSCEFLQQQIKHD